MANSRRRHHARHGKTRSVAGMAIAGASVMGLVFGVATAGAATHAYYLRGTNIGNVTPDPGYRTWVDGTITATAGAHDNPTKVDYPGGFWPVSKGYLGDPTWNKSVADGLAGLAATIAAGGDTGDDVIIVGHSQGAVVVTQYMREHPDSGNTYILTANPNRPNGGVLQRFNGLYIPFLDVSFNGSTPTDDDITYDIARQYDGWADFPKYPLHLLATANAAMGMLLLHGKYEETITPEVLEGAQQSTHGNTTYYLIPTERLPLLMPFTGIVPDAVLDALDQPLRAVIELGYDRSDYGTPTTAQLLPPLNAPEAAANVVEASIKTVDPIVNADADAEADEGPDAEQDRDAVERPARTVEQLSAAPVRDGVHQRESRLKTLRDKLSGKLRPTTKGHDTDDDAAAPPTGPDAAEVSDGSGGSGGSESNNADAA